METREIQKDTSYAYNGRIINLRVDTAILPNGNEALREVIEHNGGVCVVPIDDEDNVYLVKQFRYPYMEETVEIPAGKRDSADEDPLTCGIRELKEETGFISNDLLPLGILYPSPGYCAEKIWMYAATNLKCGQQDLDEDEFLNVLRMPLKKAVQMVIDGEIKDAKTQSALLKIYILRKEYLK